MNDLKLRVTKIEALTSKIKSFQLEAADGGSLPEWTAGAHLVFSLDTTNDGNLKKSYSLAGNPAETGFYLTAILREADGEGGSKYMHDEVSVGDVLTTTLPQNNFPLAMSGSEPGKKHLLIAGGIGITPILAMGHSLAGQGADFHIHYCSRSREDTAFAEHVEACFPGHVTFHHDGGNPSKGIKLDHVLAQPDAGTHLYICGPNGLLNATRDAASHWPDGTVHFELFSSARSEEEKQTIAEATQGDQPFEIKLSSSGLQFTVPVDKSIFEVLRDNGTLLPSACEEGWCGNCVATYAAGAVEHRDECLDDEERKTQLQTCVSRGTPGETLVLDL